MKIIFSICLLLLVSCTTYHIPPKAYNFEKSKVFNKSYDEVWGKIIKWFTVKGTPIKTIDKASGIIGGDFNLNASSSIEYFDCGEAGGRGADISNDYSGNFNIIVEKFDENKVEVTVSAFFSGIMEETNPNNKYQKLTTKIDCSSTGKLEKDILDYIGS
jgi:hypothetical protein